MANRKAPKTGTIPRKGRNSHHLIIAFVNDVRMVTNLWLRNGNSNSSNNFIGFLEDTLSNFGDKKVGLIRLDSGFCEKGIID